MQKRERYGPIYAVFWIALAVTLIVSLYLGLNSTFPWYIEHQSYRMYETMLLGSVILFVTVLAAGKLRNDRLLAQRNALENRLASLEEMEGIYVAREELVERIEEVALKREKSWLLLSPLIAMGVLFLTWSAFAFAALSPYLVENYQVNAVFVLFAGSISKIVVGLESIILLRLAIS